MGNEALFKGTAPYYAKYRLGFPDKLLKGLRQAYMPEKMESLLDIGCGTGQLTLPLSTYCERIVGIDINEEMIEQARLEKKRRGLDHIHFQVLSAEALEALHQTWDVIVCGNAFHWMDRDEVLKQAYEYLNQGGRMIILGAGSVWTGNRPWQKQVKQTIQQFLGPKRRAGKGQYAIEAEPFKKTFERSPLNYMTEGKYTYEYRWTFETLLGYLYSTSFCNLELIGSMREAFETLLYNELVDFNDDGYYIEDVTIEYFVLEK